jgi:ABC-type multidrug transport system permease subunit
MAPLVVTVCFQSIINLPPSLFIWLIYLVPSYSMSGLYMQSLNDYEGFYVYIGVMLLYLVGVQKFILTFIYLVPLRDTAATISALILTALFVSSGYLIHFKDLPAYVKWLEYVSPTTWTLPYLLSRELSPEAIASSSALMYCRNKQVQHQDIIVQLPCPTGNGTQVLSNYGYLTSQLKFYNYGSTPIALAVFYIIFFVAACLAFLCCQHKSSKNRARNDANKP